MARSHFSYEKRRKELEKKKKKEAKRLAKAERKAAQEAGEEVPEPVIKVDEFGNVIEVYPETEDDSETPEENEGSEEPELLVVPCGPDGASRDVDSVHGDLLWAVPVSPLTPYNSDFGVA